MYLEAVPLMAAALNRVGISNGAPVSGATVSDSAERGHGLRRPLQPDRTGRDLGGHRNSEWVWAGQRISDGDQRQLGDPEFCATPGGCITGQVIDANGLAPLAGATVSLLGGTMSLGSKCDPTGRCE